MRVAVDVEQRGDARIDREDDVAAATTVATVGPAEWFELLAMDRGAAVTAVTPAGMQDDSVDEGCGHCRSIFSDQDGRRNAVVSC
jgi:hypothetical protein